MEKVLLNFSLLLLLVYFYRLTRHGLHILQLENYYLSRYTGWMKKNLKKVLNIKTVILLLIPAIMTALSIFVNQLLLPALIVEALVLMYLTIRFKKQKEKKAFVVTARIKRVYTTYLVLYILLVVCANVLDYRIVLPCMALGLAPFIMQASECIIIVSFNSSLQNYGGDLAVGAMTILSSVMQFAMLPLQGFAQGAQPISSYNYGAKNEDRVVKTFKLLLMICLIYSTTLYVFVMSCPKVFVSMFTDKVELIEFTAKAIRIYFMVLFVFGAQIACQMTFVSTGNAKSSIIVACARKFILLLPLIYIMPNLMEDKTMAVYLAEPIADILAVSFTVILFAFQFKKSINQLKTID